MSEPDILEPTTDEIDVARATRGPDLWSLVFLAAMIAALLLCALLVVVAGR